ncbi:TRAP transporter small permease subunit [Stappia sediminis]|nr:TRAP transporter small permease subunit [Stappia sediminis]
MGQLLLLASLAASALAFLGIPGIPVLALVALAVLLLAAGVLLGARPAGVLIVLLACFIAFIVAPDGLPAIIKAAGGNPLRFFRSYGLWVEIAAIALMIVFFVLAVKRRGPGGYHAAMEAAEDIDRAVSLIGKVAAFLFIPMMVIIFYDVTQRKIIEYDSGFIDSGFYFSSTKLQELEWHLHAVLFMMCLGFAYVKDAHVRIELVRDRLSPRKRVWLELLGIVLFLIPYCIIIGKLGYTFAERAWNTNEISAAQTGLSHRWVIKAFLPLGFVILGAAGIAALLKCWVYLFGPPDLQERSGEYAGTHHADLPEDVVTKGPVTD